MGIRSDGALYASISSSRRKKGIGYTTTEENEYGASKLFGDIETPTFWKAVVPIILVIALTGWFQLGLGMTAVNAGIRYVDHLWWWYQLGYCDP